MKVSDDDTEQPKHVAVFCNVKVLCLTVFRVCISGLTNTAELIRLKVGTHL
jgi:hypothetical protein